jgi:ABC-type polysaccharide/polyol phosphate transport system ATPase subunit
VSKASIVFEGVWKKFNRGQRFDSLRDLVPGLVRGVFARRQDTGLQGEEFWALKDVSFEVRPGQALGIIGPNGAGKSTALKVLTKILRPDRGTSIVRGRVGALVEIASGFHPDLTGRENVYMQGAIMGMRRAEIQSRFDEIVDFSGVAEFIDTPVKRYSSGMNARLGFSVAAHLNPDVLLIDEVLSVGDLSFQEKCFARMQDFVRSGVAMAFVSHNLSAISALCDRVLVLRHGTVEALAPTHEAITIYSRMVHDAKKVDGGRPEVTLQVRHADGAAAAEVEAGELLHVRVNAYPQSGTLFHAELQVRHLESGTLIFGCRSHGAGAEAVPAGPQGGVTAEWSLRANLGRGHYSIVAAVLNEHYRWVGASAPALLSVNERQSDRALVFLEVTCEMRPMLAVSEGHSPLELPR